MKESGSRGGDDRSGQERGIDRARFSDGEGAHGYAGRHLHDRKERVEALERLALHRNAKNRQARLGSGHSRQVRCPTSSGDDHFQTATSRRLGIFEEQIGRAMGGDDSAFVRDAERFEGFCRVFHGFPITLGAHDDAHEGVGWGRFGGAAGQGTRNLTSPGRPLKEFPGRSAPLPRSREFGLSGPKRAVLSAAFAVVLGKRCPTKRDVRVKKIQHIPLVALFTLGCGHQGSSPAPVRPRSETPPEVVAPTLSELSADEKLLVGELRRHVEYLSGKVGERNESAPWELADAADYLAAELEKMGLSVERQGYETRNVAAQNLAVTISGSERGDQIFLVGAHYDSPSGDKGQNAGGSATAALLTLVSLMKDASLKRTLRFVFLSMGEGPHGDGEARGARHYARYLAGTSGNEMTSPGGDGMQVTRRAETVGVLLLDRLAAFAPSHPGQAPLEVRLQLSPGSQVVQQLLLEDFDREVFSWTEANFRDSGVDSDLLAFHQHGIPGVELRGTLGDGEAVRYEELARVVMQIRRGIGRISGERPTNDGMLTPLGEQIR